MEALIGAGLVDGVLDVTTTELGDELLGGIWASGPERLEIGRAPRPPAGRLAWCSRRDRDLVHRLPDPLPEKFRDRPIYIHDELMVATRATPDECRDLATVIARKLNAATGPTVLFVPLRGLSLLTTEGRGAARRRRRRRALLRLCASSSTDRRRGARGRCGRQRPGARARMAERLHELMTAEPVSALLDARSAARRAWPRLRPSCAATTSGCSPSPGPEGSGRLVLRTRLPRWSPMTSRTASSSCRSNRSGTRDTSIGTIARSLGLFDGEGDLEQRLVAHIENRRLLLVLDNFEQVVDAAPSVAAVVAASPDLKVS